MPVNSVVTDIKDLGKIPIRTGTVPPVYLRDIATISDSTDMDGRLCPGQRPALGVPADHQAARRLDPGRGQPGQGQSVADAGRRCRKTSSVRFEFDQSPYVTHAMSDVVKEGLLGAVADGIDGAAVPARLAERGGGGAHHSAGPDGVAGRPCGWPGRRSTS